MTKKSCKVRVVGNRKSRKNDCSQRGGDLAGNSPSAWGWALGTVGNGWTQFTNALTLQPGQNLGTAQSNNLVPVNNINAQDAQGMIGTNLKGDIPSQSGGSGKKTKKRGGAWEGVISQATAPAVLLALNQFAKKNRSRSRGRKSRKSIRH